MYSLNWFPMSGEFLFLGIGVGFELSAVSLQFYVYGLVYQL